ncbi:hypothetical protein [Emcibacter sp.]|uniref:COG4223 family protein n=1 Tax=Emcibacter sp. TaxID=1979954 RepID=UPI002AA73BA8|nr:hypothetical protein [Emcibacter sp.]
MTTADNNSPEKPDMGTKDNGKKTETGTGPAAAAKPAPASVAGQNGPAKPSVEKPSAKPGGKANWSLRILLLLLLFLAGGAVTLYFLPWLEDRLPVITQWTGHSPAATPGLPADLTVLADVEKRLDRQDQAIAALEEKSRNLNLRLQDLAQAGGAAPSAELLARIEQLEQRPVIQENRPEAEQDLSQAARIDMLLGRMSQLEASFVPLSKNLIEAREAAEERARLFAENTHQNDLLSQLESRLAQVEAFAARGNRGASLAFSLSRLRDKVVSGAAYAKELENFKNQLAGSTLAGNPALQRALATLEEQAQQGLTNAVELREKFEGLIPALIRAEQTTADAGWWQKVKDSFRNLITIRDKDAAGEETFDSLLRSLEENLNALDLEDALALMKKLPNQVQKVLKDWMFDAELWLNSREALAEIEKIAGETLLDNAPARQGAAPEETSL